MWRVENQRAGIFPPGVEETAWHAGQAAGPEGLGGGWLHIETYAGAGIPDHQQRAAGRVAIGRGPCSNCLGPAAATLPAVPPNPGDCVPMKLEPLMTHHADLPPPVTVGAAHLFSQPRFETGDPRYTWLNQVIAIGEGRCGHVEYQVSQCVGA